MQPIISNAQARETLWALQNAVIRMIGDGSPLQAVAEVICRKAEEVAGPGVACSVLRVRHGRLWTLAAPSLPMMYSQSLDGLGIGPDIGACGAAAFLCQDVVTVDLKSHPNWCKFQELTSLINAKSCWSSPITDRNEAAIATFAFYFDEKRGPSDFERELGPVDKEDSHIA